MRKLHRNDIVIIVIKVIAYLLFFLGYWLFGVWAGFAMECSYVVGFLAGGILSDI